MIFFLYALRGKHGRTQQSKQNSKKKGKQQTPSRILKKITCEIKRFVIILNINNMNSFINIKKNFKKNSILMVIVTVVASCFVVGCDNNEFNRDFTLSKSEYESILKKEMDDLIARNGRMEESFFFIHGMPVWESAKWVNVDSKDMLVIPLLSGNNHKKHIVGVVKNGKISAVITESGTSQNRILSLYNNVLYDSELSPSFRLKNGNEAQYLLLNGGSAEALFAAVSGDNTYNSQATAGTLSINATSTGSSGDSSGDVGHAWIAFTDNSGNTTTFGTWGNQGSVEYHVNREVGYTGVSYSISITLD
jgi:hypothetical protein